MNFIKDQTDMQACADGPCNYALEAGSRDNLSCDTARPKALTTGIRGSGGSRRLARAGRACGSRPTQ